MPIIDRDFPPDRLGRDRKRSSKVLVLAVILIAVLVLGAVAGLIGQMGNSKEPHPSETPTEIPARVLYTTHSPIFINGNAQFTNASGVVWGSGTASDPYVIADWDISASTATGISIQYTDAHFIVRNCQVRFGWSLGPAYDGIDLTSCVNGTLENNNCLSNAYGVFLDSSSNNTLINNTCSDKQDGIGLHSSSNNTLINNTCASNYFGINLVSSSNNRLSNNNCSGNSDGIDLWESSNNTLINNTCNSNYNGGISPTRSNDNALINNTCNSNGDWGIYLWSSSNNTLSNNNCSSNDFVGMALILSNNNTLIGNNCSSNGMDGIGLYWQPNNNNEICRNLVFDNVGFCVNISSGSNNRVWNNTFIGNNGATDTYNSSHVQACDNGTNNWWNSSGSPHGYGNWWSDWQSPDELPPYGIVDLPYNISGNASAKDHYPLTMLGSNNLPPSYVMFSVMAYGPPWGPPWVFVNESVHFTIVLTDPEFDMIELIWDFGDGSPNTYYNLTDYLDGNVTREENHTYIAPGNCTVVLHFTDHQVGSLNHSVEFEELIRVLVDDVPPVPDAGENQTVVAPTVVHFNGTGSYDDWGEIANYTWTFIYDGTPATLWGPTPSFEFTKAGIYEVVLNITDHVGNYNTTTVTIEVVNAIPEFGAMPLAVMVFLTAIVLSIGARRRKAP